MPLYLDNSFMGVHTLTNGNPYLSNGIDFVASIILQCNIWWLYLLFEVFIPFLSDCSAGFCFHKAFIKNSRDTMVAGEPVSSKAVVFT